MAPILRLTLLGGLQIALDEDELQGFVSRKAEALLVYLAVTGRSHFRETLAGLLWGTVSQKRAAGNLRVVLSNLRQLVPDHIHITRQSVSLHPEPLCWSDVTNLKTEVTATCAGLARGADEPAAVQALQEALALYRGEFLAGFYLRGAPAFEEWMLLEREYLHSLALQALHKLVEYHGARGEYASGIAFATRLLALEPWREEAHRQLMQLLTLSGQRSAALAQYDACRRLLQQELGLEPLEETTALYEQIRDRSAFETDESASALPLDKASIPFVGRGTEYTQLVAWWKAARRGPGRLTLVEGEAGLGKTRLVKEVARYAALRGTTVLYGRCYEFGGSVPYQAITEALRSYLGGAPSRPPSLSPVWLAELSRLLPELRKLRPDLPELIGATGEAAQQRLFEAVARFLRAVVGSTGKSGQPVPTMLFLDDLHWADRATLDMLHYLVRQPGDTAVWIVGTCRPEELDLSHPLVRLRQGLGRDRLVRRLALAPLAAAAVGQIATALVGGQERATLGDLLYRESEGNPFILVETVRSMQEEGALTQGADGWCWAGSSERRAVPAGVQDVILQRVGRLSPPAQRLLTLAAVIGRQFDVAFLRAVAGRDIAAVDESLEAWLARRLVRLYSTSHSLHPASCVLKYDLSHDKIREVVYHAAEPGRQRALHQQVGRTLEQLYAQRLEAVYEQLAYHYTRAGATEPALTYLQLAATKAAAVYAHQDALDSYDQALALLDQEDDRRGEILLGQARLLRFLGRYEEAIAACREVVEKDPQTRPGRLLVIRTANELSEAYRIRRDYAEARAWAGWAQRQAQDVEQSEARPLQARALQNMGQVEHELGNLEAAQGQLEKALALYRALDDHRGEAECLNGLGNVFSAQGRYDRGRQHFEKALDLFQSLGDRQNESVCLGSIGGTYWRQGENGAAQAAFQKSLEISRAIGDRSGKAHALRNLGLVHIAQGDKKKTRHCWETSAAIYRSLGLEKWVAHCLHNLGILHMGPGEYSQARQCLEQSLEINRAIGARAKEALDLGWLGRIRLMQGAYDEARQCLESAIALDEELGGGEEAHWHLAWLGATAYEMGDLDRARELLQRAVRLAREQGINLGGYELGWLVVVHLADGEGEAALAVAEQALAEAENRPAGQGAAIVLLGLVHGNGLLAQSQDPAPYFEQALALLGNDDPFGCGVALRCYGAYLIRYGERERGEQRLHQALGIFERIGAQGEVARVGRLLAGEEGGRRRW